MNGISNESDWHEKDNKGGKPWQTFPQDQHSQTSYTPTVIVSVTQMVENALKTWNNDLYEHENMK